MPTPNRRRHLLVLVLALASALIAVPAASATALTPVVDVDYSTYPTWAITPSALVGGPADTFQVRNKRNNDNGLSYIAVVDGTAWVTMNGMSCMSSSDCKIYDSTGASNVETFTIITTGTVTIVRHLNGGSDQTIGTLTLSSSGSAPTPPTGVSAVAGNAQATVSWTAPASDGGLAITSYTATAVPGGSHCTATPPATSCTVTGLANGTPYTFVVTATNAFATSGGSDVSAAVTPMMPECASSNWNFGVVDYEQTGYGDQILVTWSMPKVCAGGVASFALRQTTPDGASTNVSAAACSPDLVVKAGSSDALWSCALKVAAVPANTLEFQVVATTTGGLQATSRSVKWVRGAAPNADVSSPGAGACGATNSAVLPAGVNRNLICFIVMLVIQTEYASNGNQALTDKQARELLNIGVAFSDVQSARSGRAAKATWVSIGKKTMKIKKAGKLRVSLPLSKKGTARLRKGPLKVRVTYTLTRGTAKRTIVQYATLPRIAS